ncbi:MAG TPA: carboxypeptidase-like regulatory domain-containing protein [Thermoanaerobaculia bacterium]|jgi:hypothetical protein|nr:carboxypeptidase-like regulatory domain-containing protein [Thermoanaerobaculia bacterium]
MVKARIARHALLVVALILLATAARGATNESSSRSNQDIIAMTEAGFAPSVIIEEIRSSAASLDTTPAALTALKEAGVADEVLEYVLSLTDNGAGTCQQTYSISGSAGTAGAVVAAGGHSAPTGGNGAYEIAGLPAGTYILRPSKAGCTFSPATLTVKVPPNAAAKNFRPSCSTNSNAQVIWTVSSLCTVLYIGSGDSIYFFDSNGAVYPNGPGHPGLVFVLPVTFQFQAPRGSTLFLGANDNIGHSWCFGIDGSVPSHDPNCFATVPETGDLVRSIELTCE